MSEARSSYTWRFVLLVACIFSSLITAIFTMRWWLLAAVYPPLVIIFISTMYIVEPDVEVQRSLERDVVVEGNPVGVNVSLRNRGRRLHFLRASDYVPRGLRLERGSPIQFTSLDAGDTYEFSYALKAKRGMWAFERFSIDVEDPMGLFVLRKELDVKSYLTALPRLEPLGQLEVMARETRPTTGDVPSRRVGEGTEFHGLRDYAPSDSLRVINWKATARLERLISNEFEDRRRANVIVIVDSRWRNRVGGWTSLLDYSARAAASVAFRAMEMGNSVGVVSMGGVPRWVYPEQGRGHFLTVAYAISSLRPFGTEDTEFLIRNLMNVYLVPRSQIVLISPVLDRSCVNVVEKLVQNDFNVLVISPSPISVERSIAAESRENELAAKVLELERTRVIGALRAYAAVVDWDVNTPLRKVLGG